MSPILQVIPWLFCLTTLSHGARALAATDTPSPIPASQDDTHAKSEARDRFASGLRLYEEGDFALALIEFERAYAHVPDYRVLYNVGQVSIQLGRYARATRILQQYLAEGGTEIPEERRSAVASDLDMLESRTAHLRVDALPRDAEILLDSDVVATSPMSEALLVDAGEHRVTVRRPGYLPQTKPLALAGRDNVTLEIPLVAEPQQARPERTVIVEKRIAPTVENNPRNLYLLAGWSTTALLGTGWATTAYLGYESSQERKDAIERSTTQAELKRLETRTRHWYLASDAFAVTTVLSAGAMVYYTLASSDASRSSPDHPSTRSAHRIGSPVTVQLKAAPGQQWVAVSARF